jgi:hypothetical protein
MSEKNGSKCSKTARYKLKNSKKNKKFHEKIPFRFEIFSESYIKHHSMRK